MDGRRYSYLAVALALGLSGCIPNQNKDTSLLAKPAPPAPTPPPSQSAPESAERTSFNPFSAAPKREPNVELSMALLSEQSAEKFKDSPEQSFRQLDEARKMYQEILAYDAKNLKAFRGLTRVYVAQRDFARANATMQKASEIYPKNGQIYADWAIVFSKQNDFNGSIQKLRKAHEIDPENQEFMKALGVSLVCAGQVDQGIDMFSRARGRAAAQYFVACLYYRTNQPDAARRHLQLALETNPNFADARSLLVELDRGRAAPGAPPANPNVNLQFVSEEESR